MSEERSDNAEMRQTRKSYFNFEFTDPMPTSNKIIVFGGGCFWCTEAVFKQLQGVLAVSSGYAGGHLANPTYQDICSGGTGHAEVIRLEYDPAVIGLETLLDVFFSSHDPTTLNRQGHDVGEQYRSVVFYTEAEQEAETKKYIQRLADDKVFADPIVTAVEPLANYYQAEDYHQDYYAQNENQPYCQAVINPKIAKIRKKFAHLLKT